MPAQEGVLSPPKKHALVQVYKFNDLPLIAMNLIRIGAQVPGMASEVGMHPMVKKSIDSNQGGAINAVVGFGPMLWILVTPDAPTRGGFHSFDEIEINEIEVPETEGDMFLYFSSDYAELNRILASEIKEYFGRDAHLIEERAFEGGSHSDILSGHYAKDLKGQYINIFKEKPLEFILNQNKINNLLEKREDPLKDRKKRTKEKKKYNTVESKNIFEKENNIKIKIGDKCLKKNNGKIKLVECKNADIYNYDGKYIKDNDNYCLTYHKDKDISFTPCETKETCSDKNKNNNCKSIKFRKYGSLEFKKMNKCLNSNLQLKKCYKTDKAKMEVAPISSIVTNTSKLK